MYGKNKIVMNLTTFPIRKKSLVETLKSIIKQTVKPDEINIFLNKDYNYIHELPIDVLRNNYINLIILNSDEYPDKKDISRFYFLKYIEDNSFIFFIDDDIYYPNNYIQRMIFFNSYLNTPVCVHGSNIKKDFTDYYLDRTTYHFKYKLENFTEINVPGTGTFCYHTTQLKLKADNFNFIGGSDFDLFRILKLNGIKCFSVKRDDGWLKDINHLNENNITIFNSNKILNKEKINKYLKLYI